MLRNAKIIRKIDASFAVNLFVVDSGVVENWVDFMLKSMTGYGRHEDIVRGRNISVEIKSVNHRYFEFSPRIYGGYNFLEDKLKKYLSEKISRGKIDLHVNIQSIQSEDIEVQINHSLALGYIAALNELKDKYSLLDDISVCKVSRYPDILIKKSSNFDEEQILEDVLSVAGVALEKFISMRKQEGKSLEEDLSLKIYDIMSILKLVEEKSPVIVSNYEKKLKEKISELLSDSKIDEQRVLTEVAIFSDKVAIDEEIVRLKSHFKQFELMLNSQNPVGRKMDFLIQEMNREVNTIASKSLDSDISHMVVEMKSIIEKMREQVQNVE